MNTLQLLWRRGRDEDEWRGFLAGQEDRTLAMIERRNIAAVRMPVLTRYVLTSSFLTDAEDGQVHPSLEDAKGYADEVLNGWMELNARLPLSAAVRDVLGERDVQDVKWGEQNHTPATWNLILGEEVGEACKAALEQEPNDYRFEMVQVAAVAIAAIESHDRLFGAPVPCAACDRGDYQLGHADGCARAKDGKEAAR